MLFEIRFKIDDGDDVKIELIRRLLLQRSITEENIVQSISKDKRFLAVYLPSKLLAQKLKNDFLKLKIKNIKISINRLLTQNWRDAWKKSFKPFRLSNTFDIVPASYKNKYRKISRIPIYIDTSLAFGTGLHETTKFMAQLIEGQKGKFASFIDIGTGTGILAIIAQKCGAAFIKAVDIDKESVKIAQENFRRNRVKEQTIKVQDIGKIVSREKYDFVAANLVTQDLILFKEKIVSFVGDKKYLAVSGISLENISKFKKAFKSFPLRLIKIIKGKEWAALLYQKVY
ncbi:MAG TPA: 50S ribosomal protein L11 methyltransferase [Candidatus Omnitrophota bacterium]|nr:50S ribosomal protein L11 methyltransferase [Candidatus Omnitrophota bacterium]